MSHWIELIDRGSDDFTLTSTRTTPTGFQLVGVSRLSDHSDTGIGLGLSRGISVIATENLLVDFVFDPLHRFLRPAHHVRI